jgi:hypothetical protein
LYKSRFLCLFSLIEEVNNSRKDEKSNGVLALIIAFFISELVYLSSKIFIHRKKSIALRIGTPLYVLILFLNNNI